MLERDVAQASSREESAWVECRKLEATIGELRQQLESVMHSSQSDKWELEDQLRQQVRLGGKLEGGEERKGSARAMDAFILSPPEHPGLLHTPLSARVFDRLMLTAAGRCCLVPAGGRAAGCI